MSIESIIKSLPWIIACIASAVATIALYEWAETHDKFVAYKAAIDGAIEQQNIALKVEDARREKNLKEIQNAYEKKLAQYRGNGLRNYCLRYPDQCGSMPQPSVATGVKVDDGAVSQCVAAQPDPGFIQACTDDAVKVTAFQEMCKRNNCPMED